MRLNADGVSVDVAGARLIRGIDLDVASGEVIGIVGPNGSGKSTFLRCVYRAMRPTDGVVHIDDVDLNSLRLKESARSIAALTQDGHTELDFTVREVVAMGRHPHNRGNQALSEREERLCRTAMHRVDVEHLAGRGVLTLSGGERQRVLIARALVQEARILVLDEPTNHLDVRHQVALLSFLRTCGLTVITALHDLNLAAAACDRIAVLRDGAVFRIGPPQEVLEPGLIEEVFGVTASVVTHPRTGAPQILYDLGLEANLEGTPA